MSNFNMPIEHELWLKTNGKEGRQLDLSMRDFSKRDLSGSVMLDVIFDGSNMDFVDLTYSNLRYSSFEGASLRHSIIVKSELDHVIFVKANLCACNLFRTTFIGTDFQQANLTSVNFSSSLLKDVDFSNAIVDKCIFSGVKLSGAKGLETVKLEWIDIGQSNQPQKIYGSEAVKWLLSESEKQL